MAMQKRTINSIGFSFFAAALFFCILAIFSCKKQQDFSQGQNSVIVYTDNQQFAQNWSAPDNCVIAILVIIDGRDSAYISVNHSWSGAGFPDCSVVSNANTQSTGAYGGSIFKESLPVGTHQMTAQWIYSYLYYNPPSVVLTSTLSFKIENGNCSYIDLPAYK